MTQFEIEGFIVAAFIVFTVHAVIVEWLLSVILKKLLGSYFEFSSDGPISSSNCTWWEQPISHSREITDEDNEWLRAQGIRWDESAPRTEGDRE